MVTVGMGCCLQAKIGGMEDFFFFFPGMLVRLCFLVLPNLLKLHHQH